MEEKPYKANAELILAGALRKLSHARCLHSILIIADSQGWQPQDDGYYIISFFELHKLSRGVFDNWKGYLDALTEIKQTLEIDWGQLSQRYSQINIAGKSGVITDVIVETDLAGDPVDGRLKFTLSPAVVERLIKPQWFGQVDHSFLFALRSNYAFNAYLLASLNVIEKDSKKTEFFSKAYTLNEWRKLLGSGDAYAEPSQFVAKVLRRTELALSKVECFDGSYLKVDWIKTPRGLYQMAIKRTKERIKRKETKPKLSAQQKERKPIADEDVLKEFEALMNRKPSA
jgi:hypothetical protein